ncbi:MAG: gas vesicle protein [Ekhidna sp.]|nr:gas vesicle protein [Ekhidna sp.]
MSEHNELLFDDYEPEDEKVLLSELLDKVLNTGVTISGDLILGIADVDLIYCGVRVLLTTVDKLEENNES